MPKGSFPIYLASIVSRLPMGALGLVLILRTREMTGSYAAGGLASGAFAIALGVAAPVLGRVIDRRGQTAVLVLTGLASTVLLTLFALLPDGTPAAIAVVVAAAIGAMTPPVHSCLRSLWTAILTPDE